MLYGSEETMKKKYVLAAVMAAYMTAALWLCYEGYGNGETQENMETPQPTAVSDPTAPPEQAFAPEREFLILENDFEYSVEGYPEMYVRSEDIQVKEEDKRSILEEYALPGLERMNAQDAAEKMKDLQVMLKMEAAGVDGAFLETPEFNWKAAYNKSMLAVDKAVMSFDKNVEFTGTKASELNVFLREHGNCNIEVRSKQLLLDETIHLPSNISLDGGGVEIIAENPIEYAILMEGVENVLLQNVLLTKGFERGIYIVGCSNVLLRQNEVANAGYKPVFVMGTNQSVNIVGNRIHDNAKGGIFFEGNISDCIIQHNYIYNNRGTRNLGAGLVLCSVNLDDPYVPYEQEYGKDEYLQDMMDAPHNIVIKDNVISENYSSGIYLDGAYLCYILDCDIKDNEKEGMCLDFGTFGVYVSGSTIERNGSRNRQSDEDLEKDFVLGLGRLEDGSSTAKLPGVSLDNAAYNIIFNNLVCGNDGSGIKMVRSGYRNLILCNMVTDNNRGQNHAYHGFGVELGHASRPDQVIKGLDFTADYENIIARNMISGKHYSGIYIGTDCYCNDLIDNVILDCTEFSVENFSEYFNSAVGNHTNVPALNFQLPQSP